MHPCGYAGASLAGMTDRPRCRSPTVRHVPVNPMAAMKTFLQEFDNNPAERAVLAVRPAADRIGQFQRHRDGQRGFGDGLDVHGCILLGSVFSLKEAASQPRWPDYGLF